MSSGGKLRWSMSAQKQPFQSDMEDTHSLLTVYYNILLSIRTISWLGIQTHYASLY